MDLEMHIGKFRKKKEMIFKKNKNIYFTSIVNNLDKDLDFCPKPYRNLLPDWWNNIPTKVEQKNKDILFDLIPTARICPAIVDFFSNLYIMPMWITSDIYNDNGKIIFNNLEDKYECIYKNNLYWGEHSKQQLLEYTDFYVGNKKVENTIKIVTPWSIVTPKGYSILVIPPIYSFNQNFTPMPGIIDTDIHHEINIPSLFHSDNKSFKVKSGDPFITIMPFKRTKYNLNIKSNTSKMYDKLMEAIIEYESVGLESGVYRKMQKDRDSKTKKEKWIEGKI